MRISSICLANNTSRFNIVVNMSLKKQVATSSLCGLTHSDIQAALEKIFASKADVVTHLEILTRYAKGYHLCSSSKTEPVFNSHTYLEYLQVSFTLAHN